MNQLYVGIHLLNKPKEYLTLESIDFEQDVLHLKQLIAARTQFEADKLELVHRGLVLGDEKKLKDTLKAEDHIHCFQRTTQHTDYVPNPEVTSRACLRKAYDMLNMIGNPQLNVTGRYNILERVLLEYPQFKHDLAAVAMLHDTVIFQKLCRPEVLAKIAEHHPILIEASTFISNIVRKEASQRSNSAFDQNNDSTNSSEEDSGSLGERRDDSLEPTSSSAVGNASRQRSDRMQLRLISRQQLQAALTEIGFGSVNSLSNIAQRNTDEAAAQEENRSAGDIAAGAGASAAVGGTSGMSTSLSDERISQPFLRTQLQMALEALNRQNNCNVSGEVGGRTNPGVVQPALRGNLTETDASLTARTASSAVDTAMAQGQVQDAMMTDDISLLPQRYRGHMYSNQLMTMAQMGFVNYEMNITFLGMANGNVESAINLLMTAFN